MGLAEMFARAACPTCGGHRDTERLIFGLDGVTPIEVEFICPRCRTGEGFAFFRWTEKWQSWIEADAGVAASLLEDWESGVREV